MKKGTRVDVPSQNSVPQARRYPIEAAANQHIPINVCPIVGEPTGAREFPMPKPRDEYEIRTFDGAFTFRSHTNGKE